MAEKGSKKTAHPYQDRQTERVDKDRAPTTGQTKIGVPWQMEQQNIYLRGESEGKKGETPIECSTEVQDPPSRYCSGQQTSSLPTRY